MKTVWCRKKSIFANASGSPLNWKENNYESEYVLVFTRPMVTGIIWERKKVHARLIRLSATNCASGGSSGLYRMLIPTGPSCEDAWLVAASMIPVTQRLKFLVALRPSVTSPTVAARQAATLDRLSNGRALFNLVTGSNPPRTGRRRRVP